MQTPLSEEDDEFMYSVENSDPAYLASTEQAKVPKKIQKPVDVTANTGYDADNDPYTQMRNKRKISKID